MAATRQATHEIALEHWHQTDAILDAALMSDRHLILFGPAGTGKTSAAARLAERYGLNFASVTCHTDMAVQELIGHYVPSNGDWTWQPGPASRIFRDGGVLALNELDQAAPSCWSALHSVMDDASIARLETPNGHIRRHPSMIIVATSNHRNPADMGLPEGIQDRLSIMRAVPYPHPAAVDRLPEVWRQIVWQAYRDLDARVPTVTLRQAMAAHLLIQNAVPRDVALETTIPNAQARRAIIDALTLAGA